MLVLQNLDHRKIMGYMCFAFVQEDDYLLNQDGMPKHDFPNHWKGKNGLYCAGLSRRGLAGLSMDAQNVANDIKMCYNNEM